MATKGLSVKYLSVVSALRRLRPNSPGECIIGGLEGRVLSITRLFTAAFVMHGRFADRIPNGAQATMPGLHSGIDHRSGSL